MSKFIKPLVSVCCITYNHEKYIRDAIEGFLIQKTNFPIEIIIHDDASTDSTADIVNEYAIKYPGLIVPIYQTENQYSKGIKPWPNFVFPRARGKYIALCDGDDYWTDPYKLQKQVEFLEENDDFSLTVGGFIKLNQGSNEKQISVKKNEISNRDINGFTFTLCEMKSTWMTKTLTALFRKNILDQFDLSVYNFSRDIHLFYHLVKDNKAFYFSDVFGVYRVHEDGVNSMQQGIVNKNAAYLCYRELYEQNKDKYTRHEYFKSTLNLLNYQLYSFKRSNKQANFINLFIESLKLSKNFKEFLLVLLALLPLNFKKTIKDLK
jgi:glycosyltransferase involved in cell wall biosynthesis